eukprot:4333181-Amphidinium_carterae.1
MVSFPPPAARAPSVLAVGDPKVGMLDTGASFQCFNPLQPHAVDAPEHTLSIVLYSTRREPTAWHADALAAVAFP